jgi:hypothetical protein
MSNMDAGDFSGLLADTLAEIERLQNELIIVHEKAMEDTSAALFWYAKAKGISLEHTSIENNTIAWMQKRIAELEWNNSELIDENKELKQRVTEMGQRIAELYADNEALKEHYPHFIETEVKHE